MAGAGRRADAGGMNETAAPDNLDRAFGWLRGVGVTRDRDAKWVAGVASGLARRLGIDPVVARAAFVVLAFLGGAGITLYLLAWALLPDAEGRISAERAIRHGDAGSIVLLVFAALSLFGGFGIGHDGRWWGPGGLVIVLAAGYIAYRLIARRTPGATPPGPAVAAAAPPAPYAMTSAPPSAPSPAGTSRPAAPYEPAGAAAPAYDRPPRRPRRRRATWPVFLVVLGGAVVAYGAGLLLDGPLHYPGTADQLGMILALVVAGACLVGIGLRGRRGGLVSLLAIVLALGVVTDGASSHLGLADGVGHHTWRPAATVSDASYHLIAGSAVLDLRSLPTSPATPIHLQVNQVMGSLDILVPPGLTTQVRARVGVGDVTAGPGATSSGSTGGGGTAVETVGTGPVELTVDVNLAVGNVTVQQGAAS